MRKSNTKSSGTDAEALQPQSTTPTATRKAKTFDPEIVRLKNEHKAAVATLRLNRKSEKVLFGIVKKLGKLTSEHVGKLVATITSQMPNQ